MPFALYYRKGKVYSSGGNHNWDVPEEDILHAKFYKTEGAIKKAITYSFGGDGPKDPQVEVHEVEMGKGIVNRFPADDLYEDKPTELVLIKRPAAKSRKWYSWYKDFPEDRQERFEKVWIPKHQEWCELDSYYAIYPKWESPVPFTKWVKPRCTWAFAVRDGRKWKVFLHPILCELEDGLEEDFAKVSDINYSKLGDALEATKKYFLALKGEAKERMKKAFDQRWRLSENQLKEDRGW